MMDLDEKGFNRTWRKGKSGIFHQCRFLYAYSREYDICMHGRSFYSVYPHESLVRTNPEVIFLVGTNAFFLLF